MAAYTFNSDHPNLVALRAFLRTLGTDTPEPTPADVRAALRGMPVGDLLDLAWLLNDITELVADVRSAAVRQARMDGASVSAAARAMELSERRLLASHPIPRIEYTPLPTHDVLALYEVPTTSTKPQPVLLELDVQHGALSVFASAETEPSQRPEGVDAGTLLRWGVPVLTPRGANELMRDAKPLARRVCFGTDLDQDKAGHTTASPDQDAAQAALEIGELCAEAVEGYEHLVEVDADDYFESADRTLREYSLDASSTPEQVAAAAERAEAQALEDLQILRGAADHLARIVDEAPVDTELVMAVVEGPRPGVLEWGEVLSSGDLPSLEEGPAGEWLRSQELEGEEWIALSFDPIENHSAVAVVEVDEDLAIALHRLIDQRD